jgi:hypothetical protein
MKKYILIVTMLFTVGISGCKKDFLSLEVNPNTPSVTTPQFTLAGAEKVAADIVNTGYSQYGVWVGFWTSSGNYVPSPQLQQYQFTTDNYQIFATLYSNLTNFNVLETQSTGVAGLANFQAIAKIMKAYDFAQLVDNYNDVPYTQAFKAPVILFPAYDKGQFIYNDLVKQLDAAIALINANASATNPGTSDIIYQGNMTKWKKFANTLKLRLAIRQSNLATNAAQADLAATASEGYIDASSGAAANPGYANLDANGGQESPFWRIYGYDQNGNAQSNVYYRANAYSIAMLTNTNDPRLTQIYSPNNAGAYKGIVFGDVNAPANAATSTIGPGLLISPTMNAVLLAPAESYFLQSEAVQRGWIAGDAMALFNSGITASFTALGLTAAQATTYYSQTTNDVNWASSPNKIEAIITQKYISLNGYGNLEAFNEYRRTHYPVGVPRSIDPKAIGTTIPFRVFYPTSEYQQNAANVAAEGTIDPFASKIFWAL